MLTPYKVLESSGHTAKFADFMVSDPVAHRLYRADHIIEQVLDKKIETSKNPTETAEFERDRSSAGDLKADGLQALIEKYGIKSPDGNPLTAPVPFNLMFNTHIGPGELALPGFLRPETAQGIFLNFPRLLDFQRGKLPFAAAQKGVSYRNEISPKNGLIRCREFMMAEIEHFADPEALDDFPKFDSVADLRISMFSAAAQESGGEATVVRLGDAVSDKTVCHRTMGYYIGRTYEFFTEIGVQADKIRFRQHRGNEKAHYARDCWDCEVLCSVGWLECAGLADRQSYDLTQHSRATARSGERFNPQMFVQVPLGTPVKEERQTVVGNKGAIGKAFKGDAKAILSGFDNISEDEASGIVGRVGEALALLGNPGKKQEAAAVAALSGEAKARFVELTTIRIGGHDLGFEMYSASKQTVTVTTRSFIPCVIEPSFGIGRILTVVLEHAFYTRADGLRRVLRLSPAISPYKAVVLPLGAKIIPERLVSEVRKGLKRAGISHQTDSSGVSIGKRYARADALGVSFAITLDPVTVADGTVTLRERDSMAQVRLPVGEAVKCIEAVSNGVDSWEGITSRYETVLPPADE
jgi:glycyl-tRNA synthetase